MTNICERTNDCGGHNRTGTRPPALQRERSRACVTCGALAETFCARCEVTPYCSFACQSRDWKERHRAVCHNLARLSGEKEVLDSATVQPLIQNPAPLRRPRAVCDSERERRDEDSNTVVTERTKNDSFSRLQDRGRPGPKRSPNSHENRAGRGNKSQASDSPKRNINTESHQLSNKQQNAAEKPASVVKSSPPLVKQEAKPEVKPVVKPPEVKAVVKPPEVKAVVKPPEVKPVVQVKKAAAPAPTPQLVPATPQVDGIAKQECAVKPASVDDVTPIRKLVPKNYLIQQLSIGDAVLLSVDAKVSDCRSTQGDYVCLSLHDKFQDDFNKLCEDYVLECDADVEPHKPSPGEACSYFNVEDGGWYRARCLNPSTIALLDSGKLVPLQPSDKIRKLPSRYEHVPEFCCVLECKSVEVGSNLKATILSKTATGFKVNLDSVDTGAAVGEGTLMRWLPTVDYPAAKPVIPEVPRPPLGHNSLVLLVDATALSRAFVRPADGSSQRRYDDVVQNALLAGRKAAPLKEPPVKGQTVIAKFVDGLHYRALCKRTHAAQNKYLLEYIEYGNLEVCRNLEDLFACPPALTLDAIPTQVSMIKLASDGGELTPPAAEYIEKLKDNCDEMILTLPNGESSAPSGSEAILKLVKNSEVVNKKTIEMCTPDWKKFQEKGGDVVEVAPLMYGDLEYVELPPGPVDLDVLDVSVLEGGIISGCVKGLPHANYVFETISQKMADYCNSELGREPYLPKIEELCIAQCPPYPQWFRAVLLQQLDGAGGSTARVCYVDYGNIETIPVTLLRKMLPEFVRGVPVVGSHLEIKDFPKNPSSEQILRAAEFLQLNEEGRGALRVRRCSRQQEDGVYLVEAPELIRAMGDA